MKTKELQNGVEVYAIDVSDLGEDRPFVACYYCFLESKCGLSDKVDFNCSPVAREDNRNVYFSKI